MVEGEGAAVVFVWGERLAYLLVVYKQVSQQMPPSNSMCGSSYLSNYGMHFPVP